MRLEVLGCSGGIGGDNKTTAFRVDSDVVIDAGTGLLGLSLAELAAIDHVFLTHSHLDHVASIPWLVDTVGSSRTRPLIVHATAATITAVRSHIFNWHIWPDFTEIPSATKPYLRFEELTEGKPVQLAGRTITAFPANHIVPAVGYCLRGSEGALIFSGDTTANDALWKLANATPDLRYLIIETAFADHDREVADTSKHLYPSLLARELAKFRGRAEVHITHLKPLDADLIMAEIERLCPAERPQRLVNGRVFHF